MYIILSSASFSLPRTTAKVACTTLRQRSKQITVNHFLQEKISRQTIYSIIRKLVTSQDPVVQRSYLVDTC